MAGSSYDLFSERAPVEWLPGETLYSLCSRYHTLSGNHLASTTCNQLFGHPRQGCAHDFPSRIRTFAERTRGQLGTAENIIRGRTLLPFYLPFQEAETARAAVATLAGSSIGSLKYQLGLTASRFRANHPLKICLDCYEEDIRRYGVAYWHLEHQWPGVALCTKHQRFLTYSNLKATGVLRFQWVLPHTSHLANASRSNEFTGPIGLLANAAIMLAGLPSSTHFDPTMAAKAYRSELKNRNLLVGRSERLKAGEVGCQYREFLAAFSGISELRGLPCTPKAAYEEVAKLISGVGRQLHPIRHLALVCWLFRDLEGFIVRYTQVSKGQQKPSTGEIHASTTKLENPMQQEFKRLLIEGQSISGASKNLGVAIATGEAWAANAGLSINKRPKSIRGETKKNMVAALKRGVSKEKVAEIGGVSVSSITRLLRTEAGLQSAWHRALMDEKRRAARMAWQKIAKKNPHAGIKALRLLEPAAYAWLYRNDREWLNEEVSRLPRAPRVGRMSADWVARDAHLASQITAAGLRISERLGGKSVKLWHLYQELPDLKPKLARLDRLPATSAAIRRVLEASAETAECGCFVALHSKSPQ
ncbi:TnsD family Tn7-like transposition protein [Thiobacillus sedimenti]|uniref:TnsD family Tn7-like transposition protein n=1 Tax=Thiobacillus sedimenti TaxID=3110231 RepID=A0ABZ1CMS4_9PROT|nr:TnsD family Tn7-like transposition protein [Thiobacillus sp. SCUT-2]WRS39243.1 TnsD family Tn7-like transposition protein [Thiobacillus sp. SCUT-2]